MKKSWPIIAILLAFLLIRLPAVGIPYHQDEWKAAWSSGQSAAEAGSLFAHPPLTALAFRLDQALFGSEYLRVLPLIFGLISAWLLYDVVKRRVNQKSALIAVGLFVIVIYNIIASVMLDTDGAILPTFFLLTVWAYDHARLNREDGNSENLLYESNSRKKIGWWILTVVFLILGCLVKLSFGLVIGVLIIDSIFEYRNSLNRRTVAYLFAGLIIAIGLIVIAFLGVSKIYPEFSLVNMINHAKDFVHFGARNYLQVVVEGLKAILYLSPLLILVPFFAKRDQFKQTRIFWIYLAVGFVFYFILFDFSRGALDKYLMFAIVPLCAISAVAIEALLKTLDLGTKTKALLVGIVLSVGLFFLQFIPATAHSLYPKTVWFSRVTHFEWTMLMPFNGGSGPIGFYVSFLFIAIAFIIGVFYVINGLAKPKWRSASLVILLCVGFTYNVVMAEEYLFGELNGNAAKVITNELTFIENRADFTEYITYNDIGAFELASMQKYGGRFYATPENENVNLERFRAFKGDFIVINVPKIDPHSGYSKFFENCRVLHESANGQIKGYIYTCPK